jgi:hypothetical protein
MQFKPHSLRLVGLTSAVLLASTALLAGCSDDASTGNPGTSATGSGTGATTGAGTGTGTGTGTGAGAAGGTTGAGAATGAGGSGDGAGGSGTTGGNVGAGGNPTGGSTGNAGGTLGGGGDASGGSGGVPAVDANGKGIAQPGDVSTVNQDYIRIGPTGEIRLLNNNWGSAALGCSNSKFSVFYNQDKSFGWTFERHGDCDGGGQKPDFPQIEFGIHPFGIGNHLVTSPEFSSTTLLPLQIKDIQSASVSIDNLNITLDPAMDDKWNITFEFWLSQVDPRTQSAGQHLAYAELMTFWGWEQDRWPSGGPGMNGSCEGGSGCGDTVSTGGKAYTLWVQRDNWADGWRYFQFRQNGASSKNFSGNIDVKPLINYLLGRGYSKELWVTRLEVGSEIDINTKGTVTLDNITFEVNGETRSAGKAH